MPRFKKKSLKKIFNKNKQNICNIDDHLIINKLNLDIYNNFFKNSYENNQDNISSSINDQYFYGKE